MAARFLRAALLAAACVSMGASYRSNNFLVIAPSPEIAEQVCSAAEIFRHQLATKWLGSPMSNWSERCPITVQIGESLGPEGATRIVFGHGGEVRWEIRIQGTFDHVLNSILPHEVTHIIFASYFRCPLPRWATEGACATSEHAIERRKQDELLIRYLREGRGIPLSQMFAMKEYPADAPPLYAQGHSLTTFLIDQGGCALFLAFVSAGLNDERWDDSLRTHYGYSDVVTLQTAWLLWVNHGSPLPVPGEFTGRKRTLASLLAAAERQSRSYGTRGMEANANGWRPAPPVGMVTESARRRMGSQAVAVAAADKAIGRPNYVPTNSRVGATLLRR